MDLGTEDKLIAVWRQTSIPVIYRQGKGSPLLIRLPYLPDNKDWLRSAKQNKPNWNPKYRCWETPKSWFNELVERTLIRYEKLYIIQPYREQEKCAPACKNAIGHECQCSCMGANHGCHNSNNHEFFSSDAFSVSWREKELACRLMQRSGVLVKWTGIVFLWNSSLTLIH